MKDFSELFAENYNNLQDQWEKTLKSELKLDDVSSKLTKKHIDLGLWPTLSLKASSTQQLTSETNWKKASQSYLKINPETISASLGDDLEAGVRAFFFTMDHLSENHWLQIQKIFSSFAHKEELEVYFLGPTIKSPPSDFMVVQEPSLLHAGEVHEGGGHNVHELALLTVKLIEALDHRPTHLGVYLDSHFFKNIAKLRACRLLGQKVLKEAGSSGTLSLIALNSYREWTLFERYSNMLRNNVQVASGFVGGADAVQSSGYQMIFDLETDLRDPVHDERSLRMARNTPHILGMESMLGLVEDASYGSFHLENLTNRYAEEAWKLMQTLLPLTGEQRHEFLNTELKTARETRLMRVKTRKDILTGMNDFPDGREHLGVKLKESHVFRVSRVFEEARLSVEALPQKPKVQILLHGAYGELNNRINFIKNYFELMGLEVVDPLDQQKITEKKIIVLCAKDEDYPELAKKHAATSAVAKFVAGKVDLPGFAPIFSGQNVFEVLSGLAQKLETEL